jgi:hypothetical protein
MSLINDALKKAARQRAEEQADVVAPMPGGSRISRQGAPMKTQTMILVGAAALVLIVVSVVVTGIMLTGKPEAKPVAAAAPAAAPAQQAPAPNIVIQPAAVTVAVQAKAAPVSAPTPVPVAQAAPTPTPSPPPVVQAPEPAAASAPVAAAVPPPAATSSTSHTEMVQGVVDAYHISGVRLSGAQSKALLDGHVYKLNDIVDKTLGLKLVKVDDDHLTFVDKDGGTFVKSF